ncbi:MAG: hypothetical protein RLZZ244_192 [Verrucomicrobiota bacterium]|jgi:hypothetical protein
MANPFLSAGTALALTIAGATSLSAAEQALPFRRIFPSEYQSFIPTWNDTAFPVLCALIRSPEEWSAAFHPAPGMGQNKPFGPEAKSFDAEHLLVICRVMAPPKDEVFTVEKLSVDGAVLTLRYAYRAPKTDILWIKHFLGLRLPKRAYERILIIENGKQVASLNLRAGQWSLPPLPIRHQP